MIDTLNWYLCMQSGFAKKIFVCFISFDGHGCPKQIVPESNCLID